MCNNVITIYVDDKDKTKMFYEILFDKTSHIEESKFCELQIDDYLSLRIVDTDSIPETYDLDFLGDDNLKATKNFELIISVDDPKAMHKKSIQLGSLELKKYGDEDFAEFSINHNGHILGFKSKA